MLPAYNEQDVLPLTHQRFTAMGPTLSQCELDYELIFVNDGSRDRTGPMLDELALSDPHVKAVHLSRNFPEVKGRPTYLIARVTQSPQGINGNPPEAQPSERYLTVEK